MMGPSGAPFVISTAEMSMTIFGNGLVGCFAFFVIWSKYLSMEKPSRMQHLIFGIGINLFIHSALSLFKAFNDTQGRADRLGYKITSTIYTMTAYSAPMLLFYCQVKRCSAFMVHQKYQLYYFWTVLPLFQVVYFGCFLMVFTNKIRVVLDYPPFDYYVSGTVGYQALTLVQGMIDSLKMGNELLFFFFFLRVLQNRGVSFRRKMSHAIYIALEIVLLVSTTILYLIQMESGGVISFNWYWMSYSAVVLIEMQTFGLEIRNVMMRDHVSVCPISKHRLDEQNILTPPPPLFDTRLISHHPKYPGGLVSLGKKDVLPCGAPSTSIFIDDVDSLTAFPEIKTCSSSASSFVSF